MSTFSKNVKLILAEKKMLILFILLVACVITAVLIGREDETATHVKLGVCDNDMSEYSRLLVSYFEENEVFNSYITIVQEDEGNLEAMFNRAELDFYLVIPEDFAAKLIHIDNTPIRAVINSDDRTKAVIYKNLLEAYAKYISSVEVCCQALYDQMLSEGYSREETSKVNVSISYDLIFTALGKDSFFKRVELDRIRGISLVNYYIYSVILLIIMYAGMFTGLFAIKERLSFAGIRLKTAGVTALSRYMSAFWTFSLIYCVVIAVFVIAIEVFSPLHFGIASVLYIMAAVIVSNALFLLLSQFCTSQNSYVLLSNILILLTSVLGGGIIPVMYLPEAIAAVARFTPNYWFLRVLVG